MDSLYTWDYHINFFSWYPANKYVYCDVVSWWPEWHGYYLDNKNISVYGARKLFIFSPKGNPDLTKYTLWTNSVRVTDPSCFIHGPFNFDSQSDIISANQYIILRDWEFPLTLSNELGIAPLPLFSLLLLRNLRRRNANN